MQNRPEFLAISRKELKADFHSFKAISWSAEAIYSLTIGFPSRRNQWTGTSATSQVITEFRSRMVKESPYSKESVARPGNDAAHAGNALIPFCRNAHHTAAACMSPGIVQIRTSKGEPNSHLLRIWIKNIRDSNTGSPSNCREESAERRRRERVFSRRKTASYAVVRWLHCLSRQKLNLTIFFALKQ